MDKESLKNESNNDGLHPDDDKNDNNNAPQPRCSNDQNNSDIPNRRSSLASIILHEPEPQSILNLLQTEPNSILKYIMGLQAAVHQLQGENKSLESVNKRLKHRLRCQVSEKVSNVDPIPLPSSSSAAEDLSNRAPTSFVSVLAPHQDQNEVNPSQNVSSLNITPEATKPNSQAILPPEALPEPRVNASEMNNTVETIRSPTVATEQEANHSVSSEDISIAMNNIERSSTDEGSAGQTNSVADEVLSVSSTLSTTNIPNNSTSGDISTATTNPTAQQIEKSFAPSKEGSIFLSAKASFGTSKPESSANQPGTSAMDASSKTKHGRHPLHPFLPYLSMNKRGFLQRLHKLSESQAPADSPVGSSTSWPISAQTSKSGLSEGNASFYASRRRSCTEQLNANESRPSLTSLRTQLYFDAQLYEVHRRQLAAGRLSEEPEGPGIMHDDEEGIFPTPHLRPPNGQTESSDSLHVNVDSDDIITNDEDLDDDVVIGGDDLALDEESSTSSSAESADGRGDAVSEAPSSTPSQADVEVPTQPAIHLAQPSTTAVAPVNVSSSEKFRMNLGGKYGNLGILFRPRPPSGHRYVISVNEVNSRRRNETRLPSWVPTYAQRIECILHQFIDEVETQTHSSETQVGPHLNLVYVRLKGNPPMRLLEFEESSDSEDSCIRSINASTKQKKSCLKLISREGNIGEYRPKNLSWSQHIYIAQIPAFPLPYGDYDKPKTNSCPGIYYMGEFTIQPGKSTDLSVGPLQKYGRPKGVYKIVQRMCHCLRCNSPPPQPVESTTDVRSGDGPCTVTKESYVSYDPRSPSGTHQEHRFHFKWRRKPVRQGSVRKRRDDNNK